MSFIPEQSLISALSQFTGLPPAPAGFAIDLDSEGLSPEYLRRCGIAPFSHDGGKSIAVSDPFDTEIENGLRFATKDNPTKFVTSHSEIERAWNTQHLDDESSVLDPIPEDAVDALSDIASDAPTIRFVQRILHRAIETHASDIHLEATGQSMTIRLRIDGALHELERSTLVEGSAAISRLKVMAQLNIAETRLPQDGRMRITLAGKPVDFRVATSPSMFGEGAVLRILDRQQVELDFPKLGFTPQQEAVIHSALKQPYGIILSTGPTGSGKTTTLYAALKAINDPSRKIITVEDPIEYTLAGVVQTQVKQQIGYTFSSALRSFLRQDPDTLMVGEIRDRETAEIAIQAALTGHLLLSTLHTNSASAAITRLLDMGVDDYLLTSTLTLIIGQRLVRRLCEYCKASYPMTAIALQQLGLQSEQQLTDVTFFRPVGCDLCSRTGYSGRRGILELLEVSSAIQPLIIAHADADTIEREAVSRGMRTLFTQGLHLATRGETSIEEILRVTRFNAQ